MVATVERPQKRHPNSGRPPVITHAHATEVAKYVIQGIPLHSSLALVHRDFTLPQWNDSLARDTILARHYQQKLAEGIRDVVALLPGRNMRSLPAELWALSRGPLREHFVEGKGQSAGNTVNFNGPVQINGRQAIKALLRKVSTPPPDQLQDKPGK